MRPAAGCTKLVSSSLPRADWWVAPWKVPTATSAVSSTGRAHRAVRADTVRDARPDSHPTIRAPAAAPMRNWLSRPGSRLGARSPRAGVWDHHTHSAIAGRTTGHPPTRARSQAASGTTR